MDESTLKMIIGASVGYYQTKKGKELSDKELSKKSGVSLSTILRIKDASSPFLPRMSTIIKLARALDVSYMNLLC